LRKKVVHLTTVHHPLDPRIFHKQIKSLRDAAGYEVYLVAPHERSETIDGIPIVALPKAQGRCQRIWLQGPAYRMARALEVDCYHFHDPELIPVGYLLKRAAGARVIYDMHEDYRWHGPIEGRFIRLLERWCFSWVDHVVVANAVQKQITRSSGVPTTHIANYFKPPRELPDGTSKSTVPTRLLYAGVMSNDGGRGLSHLIDLAHTIKQTGADWQLDLVGICYRETARREAEAQIREQQLGGVIRRVGWDRYVPWNAIVPYFRAADVGVVLGTYHPNQVRKIPTKFYEYLYFGLPILCSDFPLWRRFVEQHGCGAVVPPGDIEAAAYVLRQWQSNPDEYREVSRAAQEAASKYRWKAEENKLIDIYSGLLK